MHLIWLPIIIGALVPMGAHFYQRFQARRMNLRLNCLLTRYPIIFFDSYSLFEKILPHRRTQAPPFQKIAAQLYEHGYETHTVNLPKIKPLFHENKVRSIIAKLGMQHGRLHVFVAPALADQMQLLRENSPHFASLTISDSRNLNDYLDYAISLAERDFQCSH